MKLKFAGLAFCVLLASPAIAGWEFAQWGMTPKQVVEASNGSVQIVADKKDQRVHNTPHFAKGKMQLDGVAMESDYYFAKKGKKLVMVDLAPEDDTQCAKVEAAFVSRFGEGKVERNSYKLRPDRPPLDNTHRMAIDAKTGDKVSYSAFSAEGMGYLYCKILFRSAAYPIAKDW